MTNKDATVNGRLIRGIRLHAHQNPDPERSNWRGGPLGEGYFDGDLEDMKYLKQVAPRDLLLEDDEYVVTVTGIEWREVQIYGNDDHGLVFVSWVDDEYANKERT